MTLIDLDTPFASPEETPRPPLSIGRWPLVAAAVVCVLLFASASALPAPQNVHQLWRVQVGGEQAELLNSDNLGAAPHDAAYAVSLVGHAQRLSSFDLATGKLRWKIDIPADSGWPWPVPTERGRTLLLAVGTQTFQVPADGSIVNVYADTDTQAIDSRTGKQVWRTAGLPAQADDDTVLVSENDPRGGTGALRLLHAADGTQIWRLPLAADAAWTVDGDRLATYTPDGELRLYRYSDLTLLHSTHLQVKSANVDLALAGNSLAVTNRPSSAVAYDVRTLTELWHGDTGGSLLNCGPMLCRLEPNSVTAYDPATGRQAWTAPFASISEVGTDRLILQNGAGNPFRLVDARTGARVGPDFPEPTTWAGLSGNSMVVLEPSGTGSGRPVLRMDLTTGRTVPLGATTAAGEDGASGNYLISMTADGWLTGTTLSGASGG